MRKTEDLRNITMADLADLAGVSAAAVSLALRGSNKVSKATRERITALAEEHGYVYNRQAADLRKQSSHTVAVSLHTITNPVFSTVFTAIERFFWARGWTVVFGDSEDDLHKQAAFVARCVESNLAGLVVIPAAGTELEHLAPLARRIPIVLASREVEGGVFDEVQIDYARGVQIAIDHLVALGHSAIGWIGGGSNTITSQRGFASYRSALAAHGLSTKPAWWHLCRPGRSEGREGLSRLLNSAPELTAVLCFSDLLAIGALTELRARGLLPGRDFSVMGFDDLEEASYTFPPLSTVRIDLPLLGDTAARLLMGRIEVRDRPRESVTISAELIVRGTTAPLRLKG